jgi:hypothetical protein
MQRAWLSLTFLFAHAATSQCISNKEVRPIDNAWKIESVSFFQYYNYTGYGPSLEIEFDLYRPYLDKCPAELKMMSPRQCQWALSNAGVHCDNTHIYGNPRNIKFPKQQWFNCTGRATMLLPRKWSQDSPEQHWLKWRVVQIDEIDSSSRKAYEIPFRSLTMEVVYGQR